MIENQNNTGTLNLDPKVVKVMRAIRQVESGGDYNAVGDGGAAFGAFQYNEQTGPGWKNMAKKYLNDENAPMDKANQNQVTYKRIKEWKDEGLSPEEIAARWNGAYQDSEGRYQYNNPEYGDKFRAALMGEASSGGMQYPTPPQPEEFEPVHPEGTDAFGRPISQNPEKSLLRKGAEMIFPILEQKERTGLQTAADVGLSALSLTGIGGLGRGLVTAGGRAALKSLGPKLLKSGALPIEAGIGYGTDVLSNVSQGNTGSEAFTPGLGTALGVGGGLIGRGIGATKMGQDVLDEDALAKAAEIVAPTLSKKNVKAALKSGLGQKTGSQISIGMDEGTERSARAIQDLVKSGTIKTGDTVEHKVNTVRQEIADVADNLRTELRTMDVQPILSPEELNGLIRATKNKFEESPLLVGDAGKVAERMFNKFVSFLPKGRDIVADDLLTARQKLDQWIKKEGRSSYFDPRIETAISSGLREIRQGANALLEQKAPNVPVKELLQKQSALYDALDAIIENSWKEVGTGGVQRFFKKHPYIKEGVKNVSAGLLPFGGAYMGGKITGD